MKTFIVLQSRILCFFAFLLLFSCSTEYDSLPTTAEGELIGQEGEVKEDSYHNHDEVIYYDFRGLTEAETKLALSTEPEEQLAKRAESHRISDYLSSIDLKDRVANSLNADELFTLQNVQPFIADVQLQAMSSHLPDDKMEMRYDYYYFSTYTCIGASAPSGGMTPTTTPDQGGDYYRKCYYVSSRGVHYHHRHWLRKC